MRELLLPAIDLSFVRSIKRDARPERILPFLPPGLLSVMSRIVASRSMSPALRSAFAAIALPPGAGAGEEKTDMGGHWRGVGV